MYFHKLETKEIKKYNKNESFKFSFNNREALIKAYNGKYFLKALTYKQNGKENVFFKLFFKDIETNDIYEIEDFKTESFNPKYYKTKGIGYAIKSYSFHKYDIEKIIIESLRNGHISNITVKGGLMNSNYYFKTLKDYIKFTEEKENCIYNYDIIEYDIESFEGEYTLNRDSLKFNHYLEMNDIY